MPLDHGELVRKLVRYLDRTLKPDPPLTKADALRDDLAALANMPDVLDILSQHLGPVNWLEEVAAMDLESPLSDHGEDVAFVLERMLEAGGDLSHGALLRACDHQLNAQQLRSILELLGGGGLLKSYHRPGKQRDRPITHHRLIADAAEQPCVDHG